MENDQTNSTSQRFCPFPGCIRRGYRCVQCRQGKLDPWEKKRRGDELRGRPRSESLAMAKLLGEKKYLGSECSKCGATERYTKNQGCVACCSARVTEGTRLRREAKALRDLGVTDELTSVTDDLSHPFGNSDSDLDPVVTEHRSNPLLRNQDNSVVGIRIDVCSVTDAPNHDGFIEEKLTHVIRATSEPDLSDLLGEPALRYFHHPESGSVWAQPLHEPAPDDGLSEEIDATEYAALKEELDSRDPFA